MISNFRAKFSEAVRALNPRRLRIHRAPLSSAGASLLLHYGLSFIHNRLLNLGRGYPLFLLLVSVIILPIQSVMSLFFNVLNQNLGTMIGLGSLSIWKCQYFGALRAPFVLERGLKSLFIKQTGDFWLDFGFVINRFGRSRGVFLFKFGKFQLSDWFTGDHGLFCCS